MAFGYEIAGHSHTFDYFEFITEETPYSLHDLEAIGRTVELFPEMSAMIKVDSSLPAYTAARAISSGFHSILFADIRTANDAREAVASVRPETPIDGGRLGSKAGRAFAFGAKDFDAYVQALRDVVIAIMIEKVESLNNLDEILAVSGIDMVQFGPSDFSMGAGVNQPRLVADGPRVWKVDPVVMDAEQRIISAAISAGVHPRAEIKNPVQAQFYIELMASIYLRVMTYRFYPTGFEPKTASPHRIKSASLVRLIFPKIISKQAEQNWNNSQYIDDLCTQNEIPVRKTRQPFS